MMEGVGAAVTVWCARKKALRSSSHQRTLPSSIKTRYNQLKIHFVAVVARSNSCRRVCNRFLLALHLLHSSSPSFWLAFLLMST